LRFDNLQALLELDAVVERIYEVVSRKVKADRAALSHR